MRSETERRGDASPDLAEIRPEGDRVARLRLDAAMDRYAAGDEAAFGEIYDLLAPRLLRFLARQTRSRAAAEDLLQQTFLSMHGARASYLRGSSVLPWAFAIARRLVIDRHRRRRHVVSLDEDDGWHDHRPSYDALPDEILQTKQAAERAEAALSRIPEANRAAFDLVKRDGLTVAEAADVLGISVGALKVRAHRAYEAIRAAVRDEGAGELAEVGARGMP